ncbi:hypothetical protein LOTGIDRAFT_167555 [Lottia gigantea]|uniref:CUB domain-containing protein n=1 Tax=Lottia gigantea TaxID=225164 RepID=V3ZP02_LOTGI|nr:hypothetical protein LOTGIDRAFT_167555 [Lottia gigantea]ESO86052.1 hypothetical protein LOTGIDRAFT_167555 [Lottia gigantea]
MYVACYYMIVLFPDCECESHDGVEYLTAGRFGIVNYFYSPGSTKHPNYTYYDDQFCSWQIKTEESSKVVNLHITLLHIEEDLNCRLDYITVYDGEDANATEMANLCGVDESPTFYSSGRYMFVTFTSNQQNHFRGFAAKYASATSPSAGHGSDATLGATIGSIGAGTLVIGAICCCCLNKGIKNRSIKPSTTFRFGNRGGLFGQTHQHTSTTRLFNQTQPTIPRPNMQGVFHVQSGTVQFNNTPLQTANGFNPPPSYSSLGPPRQPSNQGRPNGMSSPPDSNRSAGPISPSNLEFSDPPRYSSIDLNGSNSKVPLCSKPADPNWNPNNSGNQPSAPNASYTANPDAPWSPPPPYNYSF